MKKFYFLFITFILAGASINAQSTQTESSPKMMLGDITKSDFMKEPWVNWYEEEYQNHTLDVLSLSEIKNKVNDIKIYIFFGSWCSDSQREVPRFIKILDYLGTDYGNVHFTALDRKKTAPTYTKNIYNIQYVPTFIFIKNGKEIGRIIESPEESLEKDMVKIIK